MARRSLADWLARRAALPTWDDKIEEPIPVRLVEVTDSNAARQNLLNTSGQVTEASAATINNTCSQIYRTSYSEGGPVFIEATKTATSAGVAAKAVKRIMAVTVTATAGGEITSTPLVAATAGYQSAMKLTHIWSDQTDGSINLAFATTSGLTYGPATVNIATTANQVTPDYGQGIYFYGSADNEAINVSAAAGQTAASQVFIFIGEFWYET